MNAFLAGVVSGGKHPRSIVSGRGAAAFYFADMF